MKIEMLGEELKTAILIISYTKALNQVMNHQPKQPTKDQKEIQRGMTQNQITL